MYSEEKDYLFSTDKDILPQGIRYILHPSWYGVNRRTEKKKDYLYIRTFRRNAFDIIC